MNNRGPTTAQPRSFRLGQKTIGLNRDIRIDERPDNMVDIWLVLHTISDVPTKPMYEFVMTVSREGLFALADIFAAVCDEIEKPKGTRTQVNESKYMGRNEFFPEKAV